MFYDDGVTVFCVLYSLLLILAAYLHDHHFSHLALPYQYVLWISYMVVLGACSIYLCFCELVGALVCVSAHKTLIDLICSRRPDELERESGNGSGQCTLRMTTDLMRRLGGDTVGTDSPICLLHGLISNYFF